MMLSRTLLSIRNTNTNNTFNTQKRNYAKVVSQNEYGNPSRVLSIEDQTTPSVSGDNVQIKIEAAPITCEDISIVLGKYIVHDTLPVVPGTTGLAKVVAVGDQVKDLKVNQLVIPSNSSFGTWREEGVVSRSDLLPVSDSKLSADYYSHCVAYRLLEDFATLNKNDTIIVNGVDSPTGKAVVALAASRGLKTICVTNSESYVASIKKLGNNVTAFPSSVVKTFNFRKEVSAASPKLAIDLQGGDSGTEIIKLLGAQSNYVICGSSAPAVTTSTSSLIFNDITISGFSFTRWMNNATVEQKTDMLSKVASLKDVFKDTIEVVPAKNLNSALEKAMDTNNSSRIVLKF